MTIDHRDRMDPRAPAQSSPRDIRRRRFLKRSATAAAGFTLAIYLPGRSLAQMAGPGVAAALAAQGAAGAWQPNAFIRVGADNTVTVLVKHLEMGQGTFTGLPTLVAEEMDAAWGQMRVEGAPPMRRATTISSRGLMPVTGGSTAMANSYEQLRKAGQPRSMLVGAAAKRWNVPPDSIRVARGMVTHSSVKASFGKLAVAANEPVPANVS
jgi:isoquinoline 1-oxidoreductase beta subunit